MTTQTTASPADTGVSTPRPDAALDWFTSRGYTLLERNPVPACHEVNLVLLAPERASLVLVDVQSLLGGGISIIGPGPALSRRLREMARIARQWVSSRPDLADLPRRFDVLEIEDHSISHYEDLRADEEV